jgi:hypothetical protein
MALALAMPIVQNSAQNVQSVNLSSYLCMCVDGYFDKDEYAFQLTQYV